MLFENKFNLKSILIGLVNIRKCKGLFFLFEFFVFLCVDIDGVLGGSYFLK